ncbi:Unknown protein sequence [Pseudomonas amygdali pv. lachrymans]|nr:Unknown protein sequence [Pseudomonas amygdali pv. lachrymans]
MISGSTANSLPGLRGAILKYWVQGPRWAAEDVIPSRD